MPRFELSIEIARSPEDVFAFVTDVRRLPQWQTSAVSVELDDEVRQGTRFHVQRAFIGREVSTQLEVTAYEPPRRFDVTARARPVSYDVRHTFEPSTDGTRLDVEVDIKVGAMMRIAAQGPLKLAEREFRNDFGRLKETLETG